jgi:hypothetical protein
MTLRRFFGYLFLALGAGLLVLFWRDAGGLTRDELLGGGGIAAAGLFLVHPHEIAELLKSLNPFGKKAP